MRMKTRTPWREKLEAHKEPKIIKILIPGTSDIENIIRGVPRGKLVTDKQIKEKLAMDYHVDGTCGVPCGVPLGIHIRIIAEAAEEERRGGKKRVTPYWRIIKKDGSLFPNFPGGAEAQAKLLEEEGHTIVRAGKKPPRVEDFEKCLVKL